MIHDGVGRSWILDLESQASMMANILYFYIYHWRGKVNHALNNELRRMRKAARNFLRRRLLLSSQLLDLS
jgi:hypothetical protein